LEALVHPIFDQRLQRVVQVATAGAPTAVVLEAIKLVEAGHAAECDEVWLVVCDPEAQLARLVDRGMSESDARQRVAAQAESLPSWRAAATRAIRTDGSPAEVERAVNATFDEVVAEPH
jgi:dephospho-CoA kinase